MQVTEHDSHRINYNPVKEYANNFQTTESNDKNSSETSSKNRKNENPFETNHLVIVDNNCELGKRPNDNGECVPEE